MSRIFWDTNLFIYLFEGQGERADRVAALRQRMIDRGDQLYTSTLTLGEILVKPLEQGDAVLARRYEEALARGAVLVPFERAAARAYAGLRRGQGLRAPDAIQLACASQARVDLFVTNDDRLSRVLTPDVHFVTSLDRARL